MNFKKLLLTTAIAAVSTSALAMESMDEASLSDTAGQAGLTIDIDNANLNAFSVLIHDTDGFTAGFTNAGAIRINNIDVGLLDLTIDVDAGASGISTTDATLQVKIYNGTALTVNLGTLVVGNSQRDNAGAWGTTSDSATIATLGTLTIGATTSAAPLLNIQMGTEPQGAWMKFKPTFTSGLTLTNFTLFDSTSGATHGIRIGSMNVIDTGTPATLTGDISINATAAGLVMTVVQLGTLAGGMDIRQTGVILGTVATAPAIGDVEIIGLNLAGTSIAIIGH